MSSENGAGISPAQVNLDELYEIMESNGNVKLAELLEVLDLELCDDNKVSPITLRYSHPTPIEANAHVLFMDGHEEYWAVELLDDNEFYLVDHDENEYHTLTELRPTAKTKPDRHIIEITLVLNHSIIKF